MKIININDIEDLISAKIEIDKKLNNGKSDLNEFINKYCILDSIIIYKNQYIPFKLYDNEYIFVSDLTNIDIITEFLENIKYDYSNLKDTTFFEMNDEDFLNNTKLLLYNNKYYK